MDIFMELTSERLRAETSTCQESLMSQPEDDDPFRSPVVRTEIDPAFESPDGLEMGVIVFLGITVGLITLAGVSVGVYVVGMTLRVLTGMSEEVIVNASIPIGIIAGMIAGILLIRQLCRETTAGSDRRIDPDSRSAGEDGD